jgi:hypothetical protein
VAFPRSSRDIGLRASFTDFTALEKGEEEEEKEKEEEEKEKEEEDGLQRVAEISRRCRRTLEVMTGLWSSCMLVIELLCTSAACAAFNSIRQHM